MAPIYVQLFRIEGSELEDERVLGRSRRSGIGETERTAKWGGRRRMLKLDAPDRDYESQSRRYDYEGHSTQVLGRLVRNI